MKTLIILFASLLSLLFLTTGCSSDYKNTGRGAAIGVGAGAIAGVIIGNQSGSREKGALIGGAFGGALGSVIGNRMDKQAKELERIAETKRTEQGLVTKLKSDILFDTGKSELKPIAKENLKQMAEIMKKYPENVLTVKGYTDSVGSAKLNQELSKKRAQAVKNILVADQLPESTITAEGKGEESPVADNKSAVGRQQNRRVEIEVTVDESKVPKTTK